MAIVTVKPSKTGKKLLRYVLDGKPHCPDKFVQERNIYLSGINCPVLCAESAMSALWKDTKCKNQLFSIVQSFRDLDYQSLDDVKAAHEAGVELAKGILKRLGVKRQVLVATQADGESHHIHNHILINNCDEYGRGIPHGVYVGKVMDINDQVVRSMNKIEHNVQEELIDQKKSWRRGDHRQYYKSGSYYIGQEDDSGPVNKHQYRTSRHEKHMEQPDIQYIVNSVIKSLNHANSKNEFIRLLAKRDVTIKVRKRQKSINWKAKNLTFIHRGHKHTLRSTTIDKDLTAEKILQQLERNRLMAQLQEDQATRYRELLRNNQQNLKNEEEKDEVTKKANSLSQNDDLINNWPIPDGVTNLTSKYNFGLDQTSIESDYLSIDREQMQFERSIEQLRAKQISKYERFRRNREKQGLVKISFREFFAVTLNKHSDLINKCIRPLIKKAALRVTKALSQLVQKAHKKVSKLVDQEAKRFLDK